MAKLPPKLEHHIEVMLGKVLQIFTFPLSNIQKQIDEFELTVPWGHIACKWWGPKNYRPIVCLHGWQDNAGSFDRLIHHLPNHFSYLVVEFPGHGFSSPIPHGMIYTYATFLYVLLFVVNKFKWRKVSILAHSMGATIAYMFASSFPDRCDMIVSLDIITPGLTKHFPVTYLSSDISKLFVADMRNQDENGEPPSYTYETIIQKMYSSKQFPMAKESIPFLLYRGVKPSKSDPNKYYFTRDSRLRQYAMLIPIDVYEDVAKPIVAPFCFIKARHSFVDESQYARIYENMSQNPHFELHRVDGGHHVHLDNPMNVGEIISKFINKYRPLPYKL